MMADIVRMRLRNQCLSARKYRKPSQLIHWFGAMQSQDFAAAKWAVALRTIGQTDADIENAFNERDILRTHIMRPTWHFVTPSDIRWILTLTSPRVRRFNGYYYRRSGLSKDIFKKSNNIIQKALQGGKQLTRGELNNVLKKHTIPTEQLGLSYIIMQAELDGIICSGPRIGKQFTYMLLEERVPQTKELSYDEALATLTIRYFQSHGPARIRDAVWWSGLTVADIKRGIEIAGSQMQQYEKDGETYWFMHTKGIEDNEDGTFLLPGFDEYFIAYNQRSDILEKKYAKHLNSGGGMISGAVIVEGKMIGGWKRSFEKKSVHIRIQLFEPIMASQIALVEKHAFEYGKFIGMPASFAFTSTNET